jgi:hypothetical protein
MVATTAEDCLISIYPLASADYDGKNNITELADQMKQVHWDLFLEYNPGQTIHDWTLFP